ncbi:MAG: diguanylate cyclase [Pseudomonadota bacterium]
MTLRQKILLLGLTAILGVAFGLWRQFAFQAAELGGIGTMVRNVEAIGALSAVTHELQRERGYSTYRLAGTPHPTTLDEEIARTDAALARLDRAGQTPPDFRAMLRQLRATVTAGALPPLAARDDFSLLVRVLIDRMEQLAREPAVSIARSDLSAHAHLVAMKEYLGQMRATLAYWIVHPGDGRAAFDSMVRLNSLFDEAHRKFGLEAAPELHEAYLAGFAGDEVTATLAAMRQSVAANRPPRGFDAPSWLRVATAAIDRLFALENRSLALIEQKAARRGTELRDALLFDAAVALLLALTLVGLTVSAIVGLLHALSRTLRGMENIAATQDFGSRIPADSRDEIGRIARSFNALLDVAERLLREKEYLAATDPLTGISNRLRFAQVLDEEAQRKRRNQTAMALVLFDIDRFKRINDKFGHGTGDAVLKQLVRLVRTEVRATDFLGRWGGEEFILLLRDDGCDAAFATAEKLRERIAAEDFPDVGRVTCSFGVTAWAADDTAESLVARADRALYISKQNGRDQTRCAHTGGERCPGLAACVA